MCVERDGDGWPGEETAEENVDGGNDDGAGFLTAQAHAHPHQAISQRNEITLGAGEDYGSTKHLSTDWPDVQNTQYVWLRWHSMVPGQEVPLPWSPGAQATVLDLKVQAAALFMLDCDPSHIVLHNPLLGDVLKLDNELLDPLLQTLSDISQPATWQNVLIVSQRSGKGKREVMSSFHQQLEGIEIEQLKALGLVAENFTLPLPGQENFTLPLPEKILPGAAKKPAVSGSEFPLVSSDRYLQADDGDQYAAPKTAVPVKPRRHYKDIKGFLSNKENKWWMQQLVQEGVPIKRFSRRNGKPRLLRIHLSLANQLADQPSLAEIRQLTPSGLSHFEFVFANLDEQRPPTTQERYLVKDVWRLARVPLTPAFVRAGSASYRPDCVFSIIFSEETSLDLEMNEPSQPKSLMRFLQDLIVLCQEGAAARQINATSPIPIDSATPIPSDYNTTPTESQGTAILERYLQLLPFLLYEKQVLFS
eukprot:g3805.t1